METSLDAFSFLKVVDESNFISLCNHICIMISDWKEQFESVKIWVFFFCEHSKTGFPDFAITVFLPNNVLKCC